MESSTFLNNKSLKYTKNHIESIIVAYGNKSFYQYPKTYFHFYPYLDKFNLKTIQYSFNKINFSSIKQKTTIRNFLYKIYEIYGPKPKDKDKQTVNLAKKIAEATREYSNIRKFSNKHKYTLFLPYNTLSKDKKTIKKLPGILLKKFKPYNLDFLSQFLKIYHIRVKKRDYLTETKLCI